MLSLNPLSLFFDKFKVTIVLALLAIIAAMVVYHAVTVGLLKEAVEDAQRRNGELVIENSALAASNKKAKEDIAAQNKAVRALTDENEEMSKKAKEQMAEIEKQEAKWQSRYNGIFNTKPAGTDECSNILTLLNDYHSSRMDEEERAKP